MWGHSWITQFRQEDSKAQPQHLSTIVNSICHKSNNVQCPFVVGAAPNRVASAWARPSSVFLDENSTFLNVSLRAPTADQCFANRTVIRRSMCHKVSLFEVQPSRDWVMILVGWKNIGWITLQTFCDGIDFSSTSFEHVNSTGVISASTVDKVCWFDRAAHLSSGLGLTKRHLPSKV